MYFCAFSFEPSRGKTNNVNSKQVPHKPSCTSKDEMYYPYSENKGADQLRGYRKADLHLWFRICRLLVFS